MKKIIFITTMLLTGWSVQAQKISSEKVPTLVIESFNKLYPGSANVKWEIEEENYEATYKKDKIKSAVVFSAAGVLIQSEKSLGSVNELPAAVLASLKKDFAGYSYEEPEIVKSGDGKVSYEVEAENAKGSYELFYDAQGNLIKKTQIEGKK